jgi:putative transposase
LYKKIMPNYRRAMQPGGTFFLTLVTERRRPIFAAGAARALLRKAIDRCRRFHPFELCAIVLLHDHLHLLITLPDGDADFSRRITFIKSAFTQSYLASGGREQPRSSSRLRQRARGVWQRRFWEHTIRDEADRIRHLDYIHYNPVKHGYVNCPHAWPHSSFQRFVVWGHYEHDWCCQCGGRVVMEMPFDKVARSVGE